MSDETTDSAEVCVGAVRDVVRLARRSALTDHERRTLLDALGHGDCVPRGERDRGGAEDCGNHLGCPYDPPCERHGNPDRQEMVGQLDVALHGETWARPRSPSVVWRDLLGEVASLARRRPAGQRLGVPVAALRDIAAIAQWALSEQERS